MEECGSCPVFASFTLAFALQLRKKHGKTSVRVRKTSVRLRKTSVRLRKTSVRLRKTSVKSIRLVALYDLKFVLLFRGEKINWAGILEQNVMVHRRCPFYRVSERGSRLPMRYNIAYEAWIRRDVQRHLPC